MAQTNKLPEQLSAQDRSSFAYKTIKDRLPVILVKTIDFFHRQRKELLNFHSHVPAPTVTPKDAEIDAKEVIAQLAKLRKDLETNKPVELFRKLDLEEEFAYFNDDIDAWNASLESQKLSDGSLPRWFDSPWLLVECYLYRRIKDIHLNTKVLKMFDTFVEQKQQACRASRDQMIVVACHLLDAAKAVSEAANKSHPSERSEFSLFVQLALWANKSDLSISGMDAEKIQSQKLATNIRDSLESLSENILCDNSSELWFKVQSVKGQVRSRQEKFASSTDPSNKEEPIYVDLVVDNAGYEIFVDLCLIHFLSLMFSSGEPWETVRFRIHVKRMPWFVSDALKHDIDWLLNFMTSAEQQNEHLKTLGQQWRSYLATNFWQIHEHKFWTLPHDYSSMEEVASDLYSTLKKSALIIFKGDLNYRKLTGDRKWHILTPFRVALRNFLPAPLVTLRTAKADVVVGIEDINLYARINNNELPRDWMISGDFGLIQFLDPL